MKCPHCRRTLPGADAFYQRSYPGKPGYIPPRCGDCYDATVQGKLSEHSRRKT